MPDSGRYLWKTGTIDALPSADADCKNVLSRVGPIFRIPVNAAGVPITTDVIVPPKTSCYLVTAIKNDFFYAFAIDKVNLILYNGITPSDPVELLNL